MNELYLYLLAVIAAKHGIEVHGVTLMSTHEHLVVTDTRGRLPRFLAELHRLVALCVKVYRKWEGEVWDGGKTSVVELRTPHAILEKLAYCAANPVAAGLVHDSAHWPGIVTLPSELGRARKEASRPVFYLDARNEKWPEKAVLELSLPAVQLSGEEIRRRVETELRLLEGQTHGRLRGRGSLVPGARSLSRMSPFARAKSWESVRALNPSFAVGRDQNEAFFEAVKVLKAFRRAYRVALDAWRGGARSILFPNGTWLMCTLHGASSSD